MDLAAYLARIGYHGPQEPTATVLKAVHRCHATTIAYENIDVYLERRVSIEPADAFDKLVTSGRGGWCYENNGLLGWALGELGFNITRVAGAVLRSAFPDSPFGGHLMIRIDLAGHDEPLIADVGLGGALIEPLPVRPGEFTQGWRIFRLEQIDEAIWRFHNTEGGQPRDVDFTITPVDNDTLATNSAWLQETESSTFRQNLVAGKISDEGGVRLTGRTLTDTRTGVQRVIESERELVGVLRTEFAINVPSDIDGLWRRVEARHHDLFGSE